MVMVADAPVVAQVEQLLPELQSLTEQLQELISRYQAKYSAPHQEGGPDVDAN